MLEQDPLFVADVPETRRAHMFRAFDDACRDVWSQNPDTSAAADLSGIGPIRELLQRAYSSYVNQREAHDLDLRDGSGQQPSHPFVPFGAGRSAGGFNVADHEPYVTMVRGWSDVEVTQRQYWAAGAALLAGQWMYHEPTVIGYHFGAKLSAHSFLHHAGCVRPRERCQRGPSGIPDGPYWTALEYVIQDRTTLPAQYGQPEFQWYRDLGLEDRYFPLVLWYLGRIMESPI